LNKVFEEKTEEIKQDDAQKNQNQEQQQQHLSLTAQAYILFSDRKTPLEVAIALNLGQPEVTKLYRVLEAKTTTQSEYGL
jgi:predicted component of type VI protein secretion system